MLRTILVVILAAGVLAAEPSGPHARNVILFLADAGGLPTLAAASLYGYGAPRKLFVDGMPHIGLSDTSSAAEIVTDSAAGMTAIVTGVRTRNGMLSELPGAASGKTDGPPLKTILEYAEERGLATGVITNDELTGATPAALYAKTSDRDRTAEIFLQAFAPRYGDGIDVMIGPGRAHVTKALQEAGDNLDGVATAKGRPFLSAVEAIPSGANRAIVLLDSPDLDLERAVDAALTMLLRNPRGYFLMVESDVHTDNIRKGLDRMVAFDRLIQRTAERVGPDTLLLFTADHSFDLRLRGGTFGHPLLDGVDGAKATGPEEEIVTPALHVEDGHTGEPVLVAAQGPGSDRVHGYMANTDLFGVMLAAYGWTDTPVRAPGSGD
jgi:alkaline phosphatase